jgi:hypothetical protein
MNDPRTAGDSVASRRDAILGLAGAELGRGRRRREFRARAIASTSIALAAALVVALLSRPRADEGVRTDDRAALAIDFATIGGEPVALVVDFVSVGASAEIELATLDDDELREVLAENGHCASILRFDGRTILVDCSTGLRAVIQ